MGSVIASKAVRTSTVCIVTMAALVGSTRAASAQCKPAVVAQGDPALVTGLTTRLAANGIATASVDGCPTLRVKIEQRGTQLHVRLADASQRTGERDVQDMATAAAIVESWTYQEIEAGTLPEEHKETPLPIILAPRRTARSGISASVLSGLGSNGATTWIGGSLSACARIGLLCAGGTLRTQLDTKATGETTTLAQSSYTLGALATLDLPRKLGSLILSPGVGVGYTYLHVTTTHHDAMNNPFDVPTADHQLRGGAHAALLKSLNDHVAAFADLWADAALLRSDSHSGPGAYLAFALGLRFEER
jgi:hypothetical protein